MAERLDLRAGIAVAVGNVDAHVTAPAACAIEPGQMLAVMGTSTCHVMNGDRLAAVPGMCGVVDGGITPGLPGYEAGQSGVGDIFAWFVEHQLPGRYSSDAAARGHRRASVPVGACRTQAPGAHGLVALDWLNGNRSVLVDHELSGAIVGLTLGTRAGRHLPRPGRVDGVRGTDDHRDVFVTAGVPVRGAHGRRWARQEPLPDAGLRRRAPTSAQCRRL